VQKHRSLDKKRVSREERHIAAEFSKNRFLRILNLRLVDDVVMDVSGSSYERQSCAY